MRRRGALVGVVLLFVAAGLWWSGWLLRRAAPLEPGAAPGLAAAGTTRTSASEPAGSKTPPMPPVPEQVESPAGEHSDPAGDTGNVVEGFVREARTRTPVPGITLRLTPLDGFGMSGPTASSSADGRYRFSGVPAGTAYWVEVLSDDQVVVPAAYEERRRAGGPFDEGQVDRLLSDGTALRFPGTGARETRDVDVVLRVGAAIRFRLVFPGGPTPIPFADVEHLVFTDDPTGAGAFGIQTKGGGMGTLAAVPIDGAWISTVRAGYREQLPQADPSFRAFLARGWHDIRVQTERFVGTVPGIRIRGGEPERVVEVRMRPRPRVWVQLVDADGGSLATEGAAVSVGSSLTFGGGSTGSGPGGATAKTDASGRAEISSLLPPLRLPVAEGQGDPFPYRLPRWERVNIAVGESQGWQRAPIRLTLFAAHLARWVQDAAGGDVVLRVCDDGARREVVRVVDPGGHPVGGMRLEGRPPDSFVPPAAATSAPDGCAVLTLVRPPVGSGASGVVTVGDSAFVGELSLPATASGFGGRESELEVTDATCAELLRTWQPATPADAVWGPTILVARPGGRIRFRVHDDAGTALAGTRVHVVLERSRPWEFVVPLDLDAEGQGEASLPRWAEPVPLKVMEIGGARWWAWRGELRPDVLAYDVGLWRVTTVKIELSMPAALAGVAVTDLRWVLVDPETGQEQDPLEPTAENGVICASIPARPAILRVTSPDGSWRGEARVAGARPASTSVAGESAWPNVVAITLSR